VNTIRYTRLFVPGFFFFVVFERSGFEVRRRFVQTFPRSYTAMKDEIQDLRGIEDLQEESSEQFMADQDPFFKYHQIKSIESVSSRALLTRSNVAYIDTLL
jgi:hypothetical protein